ncbi:hypothetical protein AA313_de0201021 [Arthrobotrys entomopaga]|nr:hypothetical protein AA313_de0201021 [Arthrobotrys entomopaga]
MAQVSSSANSNNIIIRPAPVLILPPLLASLRLDVVSSPIEYFPSEITLLILSYLCQRDRKSFSLCSKFCRDLVSPVLFRRIRLSTTFAASASDDDTRRGISRISCFPRHVSLDCIGVEIPEAITNFFCICTPLLRQFSNIISLKLACNIPRPLTEMQHQPDFIYRIMWRILTFIRDECTFHETLKAFTIEILNSNLVYTSTLDRPIYTPQCPESAQFLGLAVGPGNSSGSLVSSDCFKIPHFPALEQACVSYPRKFYNSANIFGTISIFSITTASTASLRRICLQTTLESLPLRPLFHGVVYPNVKELCANIDFLRVYDPLYLEELTRVFPNVEDAVFYPIEQRIVRGNDEKCLKRLDGWKGTLKRAVVFWPRLQKASALDNVPPELDRSSLMTLEELREHYERWMNGQWGCLETVVFLKSPKDVRYERRRSEPFDVEPYYEAVECTISACGEEGEDEECSYDIRWGREYKERLVDIDYFAV